MNAWELLPAIRDLFSRRPECRHYAGWELQWLLYALGYTDELEDELLIVIAARTAHSDWDPEEAA